MKRPSEDPLARGMVGLLWARSGPAIADWRADVLVPIPMHWRRRAARGANCPETIAAELARRLKAPISSGILRRTKATRPQGPLSPPSRRENLRGAFRLVGGEVFRGARVLLVDDILTSGATCDEAAKLLRKAGAAAIGVAVIGRGTGDD